MPRLADTFSHTQGPTGQNTPIYPHLTPSFEKETKQIKICKDQKLQGREENELSKGTFSGKGQCLPNHKP